MKICDLLKCIDRVLDGFGSGAKQSVYLNIALRKGIPYESLLENPDALSEALKEVFDDSSNVVMTAIANEIGKVFGIKLDSSAGHFQENIELACKQISR